MSKITGKDGTITYSFIHKTILEHFAAEQGVIDADIIVRGKHFEENIFNDTLVIDKGLMSFYVDILKSKKEFKENLL